MTVNDLDAQLTENARVREAIGISRGSVISLSIDHLSMEQLCGGWMPHSWLQTKTGANFEGMLSVTKLQFERVLGQQKLDFSKRISAEEDQDVTMSQKKS